MTALRYDGREHCPPWMACISCGTTRPRQDPATTNAPGPLVVAIASTIYGPICVGVCWGCSAAEWLPSITADAAMRLVVEHRGHAADGGAR